MLRIALVLVAVLSLSACEWENRPDGIAPNHSGDMEFTPEESYDSVEPVELDSEGITEPLDAPDPAPETATE